jgi:Na+-translocating ferredoxin:NAD+ oxidoreductase RnfD subunit
MTGPIGLAALCAVLLADVAFGGLVLTKYAPPLVPYVGAAMAAFLTFAALRVKR